MKIFIDPGHGGGSTGAFANGLTEKEMTLLTAKAMENQLLKHGYHVKLSRCADKDVFLCQRARRANTWNANYFISCHYADDPSRCGKVFYQKNNQESLRLAEAIAQALRQELDLKILVTPLLNSFDDDYFAVLRQAKMPAVMLLPCALCQSGRAETPKLAASAVGVCAADALHQMISANG